MNFDFVIKDTNFVPLGNIDEYIYAIWTERFSDVGDFELQIPINSPNLEHFAIGNYLTLPSSDRAMIIEKVQLDSNIDTGLKSFIFSGQSLESILKRRIVWGTIYMNGKLVTEVNRMIRENLIAPKRTTGSTDGRDYAQRRIPNFVLKTDYSDDAYLNDADTTIQCQITGSTLYDALLDICQAYNIGFKVTLNASNQFYFQLYSGTDRSSWQTDRNAVIFSPEFDTMIKSRYVQDTSGYKNVTLVLGEDDGESRRRTMVYVGDTEPSGLERRELYTDARDLQSERDDGTTMSETAYMKSLEYRGNSKLNENSVQTLFDSSVETNIGPQYNQDYFIGDYVTMENEFGIASAAQVVEYIQSFDSSGYTAYPTFKMVG